ncbi:hypothetical protein GW796_05965 [archaeon]|nr:hypothetical protein [archaeon]NCQ51430.1 hypothetical protein [archaeon]NCT58744.1 hypothetical protein [archaeon]
MSNLLNQTVLNELRTKFRKHPILTSNDSNIENFLLSIINNHFPKGNELKATKSKDIFNLEFQKVFKELDNIVNTKKKAAK